MFVNKGFPPKNVINLVVGKSKVYLFGGFLPTTIVLVFRLSTLVAVALQLSRRAAERLFFCREDVTRALTTLLEGQFDEVTEGTTSQQV